ncbi:sulfur carrier protein ThiS [Aliivibrio sp. S3MY1]|uniref:sulfur carrier protein ThiS n=1 Tax=unclassified Aliivibrio TaxID=2645654 RepID=UPI00237A058B|nr:MULTISPECIES: sulfur carrier protein ThiS [unclassified Aliivibrio]MDD9195385.1 sulfur carrier protein ThiS [Aliivibrio sp. S3MY1]MDD9198984.1 sulfur carrier protein ThiS [Aliivibrio sp. S2MY1]
MSNLITIELNNVVYRIEKALSIHSFLTLHKVDTQGCALAMNNQIIPRAEWQTRRLSDGESISLFQAIAGG